MLQYDTARVRCHTYLGTAEGPHCAIMHTGDTLAHVERAVKQGLILNGELMSPVPHAGETQSLVLPELDAFALRKVLGGDMGRDSGV